MNQQHYWLSIETAITILEQQISTHGGTHGIRDLTLLESAMERPKMAFHYQQAPLPTLAAYYAIGITQNHPFFDGNKRVRLRYAIHSYDIMTMSSLPQLKKNMMFLLN